MLAADPPTPTSSDRCAVCGMFVSRHPGWIAAVVNRDGSRVFFDGPKDMFRYVLNPEKYKGDRDEIGGVFVTDYYTTRLLDARDAFFVSGSDIMGPMGNELIAISNENDAKTFLEDHGGDAILSFGEVTLENIPR